MPFCYDSMIKYKEILRNCSGFAVKGCDLKIVLISWILRQSMLNSSAIYLQNPTKNIASAKMVMESPKSKALAKGLGPP